MMRNRAALLTIGAALFGGALLVTTTASAWDYFIDEATDFTGNGCSASDLNTVTSDLAAQLYIDGITGFRYTNSLAWPQDFWESCSSTYGTGGQDASYGDSRTLSVYAGHGTQGAIMFGYQHSSACWADLGSNMRLGSMSGTDAAHAVYITSCTLNTSALASDANYQWLRQQFGFHNSPSVPDGSPYLFYKHTGNTGWPDDGWDMSNTSSWVNWLEEDENEDENNSPIVVSAGATLSSAESVRDTAQLRENVYNGTRSNDPACQESQPAFHYVYVLRNNGGC